MTTTTPTTEVQAVNMMLDSIGESPISTLAVSPTVDIARAKANLDTASREVQTKGWSFNTEEDYPLSPDPFTKEILLPANTMSVDTSGKDVLTKVVQRGQKLYNPKKHTFQWDAPLNCELVVLLPFDELPQHARHYIAIKAARKFQAGMVGDQLLYAFTEKDETDARALFKSVESDTEDNNYLDDNSHIMNTLQR